MPLAGIEFEGCRIGAENELARTEAQQPRRVIQIFSSARLGRPNLAGPTINSRASGKPLSFLEIGLDFLGYSVDRLIANQLLAVDEKGRRGVDPELFGSAIADVLDAVEHLLICQALIE